MIRKIVNIDPEKCSGCGACAQACHEGAIAMIDGIARLIKDDYCDGLGDCLPACPADAITIIEREAAEYDEEAVAAHMEKGKSQAAEGCSSEEGPAVPHMCPGTMSKVFARDEAPAPAGSSQTAPQFSQPSYAAAPESQLRQWPCQIQLMPIKAPYYDGARLLIAADCTAYAYGNFHNDFIKGHITLVGCPKLDFVDYSEKLTEIIRQNDIKDVTLVRMEVPCCGGLQNALIMALKNSGKMIPWQVKTISCDGKLLD